MIVIDISNQPLSKKVQTFYTCFELIDNEDIVVLFKYDRAALAYELLFLAGKQWCLTKREYMNSNSFAIRKDFLYDTIMEPKQVIVTELKDSILKKVNLKDEDLFETLRNKKLKVLGIRINNMKISESEKIILNMF